MSDVQKASRQVNRSKPQKKSKRGTSVVTRYLTTAGYITTLAVVLLYMGSGLAGQFLVQ